MVKLRYHTFKWAIVDEHAEIYITRKNGITYTILVDIHNLLKLDGLSICIQPAKKTFYVIVGFNGSQHLLHRFLLPTALRVDHEDGNGLNNLDSNLRACSDAENGQNRVNLNSNNTSGVAGVSWQAKSNRWVCYAGSFLTIEEAAEAMREYKATTRPFSKEARDVKNPEA